METVSTLNKETLKGVQDLIEINIDSANGFAEAAEKVENNAIATLFRTCAEERRANANDLKSLAHINGEEPESDGSWKAKMHRWWIDIRSTVQGGDEHAMLAEAERGEDAIKHRYEDVLKDTAGSAVNDVLQTQYAGVKARHDQIRDMRDARA